jgi:Ser/Thr protein kinase RdoA (MazF antagonist)
VDVTYSILSAHALAAEVAQAYDVGPPIACHLLRRGMSDSYCLATRTKRLMLRVYRASHSPSAVAFELDLLSHLAAAGVPVSAALPAKNGLLALPLAAPEGVRQLALFPYPARQPFDSTDPGHWRSAGQLLASVHDVADGLISANPRTRLDLVGSIDAPLAAIRPLFAERPADAALVETLAAEVRSRLDSLVREGLDWGICHGSFSAKAMHRTPDRRMTLDDFEGCAEGWRAWDLAGMPCAGRQASVTWEHFAKGYSILRPLGPRDCQAAAIFVPIRHLSTLATFACKVDERGIRHVTAGALDRWLSALRDCDAVLERQT